MIINELITNAIKHNSKLDHKVVFVELSFTENTAVLTVLNSSLFKENFPDFELGEKLGVGLSLIKAMLPREGAQLTLMQKQNSVCAEITLADPVVTINTK